MGSVMGGGRRDAEVRWGCGVLERRMAVAVAGSRWGVEVKANNFTGISNSSTAVVCYTGFYCVTGLCGRPMNVSWSRSITAERVGLDGSVASSI